MDRWLKINSAKDVPKKEMFVAVIHKVDMPVNSLNLFAEVGLLSWSDDFSYGSVISDGEVISLNEIGLLLEIESPIKAQK